MSATRARAVAAVLVALIAGCRRAPEFVDQGLTAFVLPDSVMLAEARLDQIRQTPAYRLVLPHLAGLESIPGKEGDDPLQNIREVLVSSDGKDTLLAARGQFSQNDLQAREYGVYGGYTLYAGGGGILALIDPTLAIAGSASGVRTGIDQFKAGRRSGAALLQRAARLPDSQIRAVSNGGFDSLSRVFPNEGNAQNMARMFRSIQEGSLFADLRNGIHAVAEGLCRNRQDAETLGNAARGLIGLARLSAPNGRLDLQRLYSGIKVEQTGLNVKVTADVPPDLLKILLSTAPGSSGPPR